jgi:hypothetical protein
VGREVLKRQHRLKVPELGWFFHDSLRWNFISGARKQSRDPEVMNVRCYEDVFVESAEF